MKIVLYAVLVLTTATSVHAQSEPTRRDVARACRGYINERGVTIEGPRYWSSQNSAMVAFRDVHELDGSARHEIAVLYRPGIRTALDTVAAFSRTYGSVGSEGEVYAFNDLYNFYTYEEVRESLVDGLDRLLDSIGVPAMVDVGRDRFDRELAAALARSSGGVRRAYRALQNAVDATRFFVDMDNCVRRYFEAIP